jgi:dipeptide/tripeptide permease
MTQSAAVTSPAENTWRFPATFWVANVIELAERAAYYGVFIALAVFLTSVVGFTDIQAGWVGASFAGLIYLLPFVTGAISDRIGFRPALIIAFALLTAGYGLLWIAPRPLPVILGLFLAAVGGSFVKPLITGTVMLCSSEVSRARAFSLFYMLVNVGSFSGKSVAGPVRQALGVGAVPLYSAGAAAVALAIAVFFYWPKENTEARPRSVAEAMHGLATVLRNGRFVALILITAGFWLIQGQMYASMPKYVLRMVGDNAMPEWYANVNPLVVVLCVVPVTHLVRKLVPIGSIAIALGLIPISAMIMGFSTKIGTMAAAAGIATHPITIAIVLGISLQGLAECFLSPRYLEYASKQAPPGQEGLYMGYAHVNIFFAWFFGFILSGYLLNAFCPDPTKLSAADQAMRVAALAGQGAMPAAYAHAHVIWWVFASFGAAAFIALMILKRSEPRASTP